MTEVRVDALDAARLEPLIGSERMARFEQIADAAQEALAGRTVLNINSTATGGGVAEMLQTLLAYGRGSGIDARWLVIEGDPAFFAITKRVHHGLYGSPGDGGELGAAERAHYERATRRAERRSARWCVPGTSRSSTTRNRRSSAPRSPLPECGRSGAQRAMPKLAADANDALPPAAGRS